MRRPLCDSKSLNTKHLDRSRVGSVRARVDRCPVLVGQVPTALPGWIGWTDQRSRRVRLCTQRGIAAVRRPSIHELIRLPEKRAVKQYLDGGNFNVLNQMLLAWGTVLTIGAIVLLSENHFDQAWIWSAALLATLAIYVARGTHFLQDNLRPILGIYLVCLLLTRRRVERFVRDRRAESLREREQSRMRDELNSAREMQLSMLARHDPEMDWLDFSGVSLPALEVGD